MRLSIPAALVIAFLCGWGAAWSARPAWDRWQWDRYVRALCADGEVKTYIDRQITCEARP